MIKTRNQRSGGKKRVRIYALVLSFLLVFLVGIVHNVLGTTFNTLPESDGAPNDWTPDGCTDHYDCVNDPIGSPDEASTKLDVGAKNKQDVFNFVDHTTESGTITNVRVYSRAMQTLAETYAEEVEMGGTAYVGTTHTPTGSWVDYYSDWADDPSGGAWTWTDIDNLQAGVKSIGVGGWTGTLSCTAVWVVVTYTAPSASIEVTLRKSNDYQERIGVGIWGNMTWQPADTEVNSSNYLRVQCSNCDGVDDSFWTNWSGTTWASATTGETIPIDSNFRYWYYETTSGTWKPDDGGATWLDSDVDADGDYQITFTNSGTTYVWVRYRIEDIASDDLLGEAYDLDQAYTVELDR